MLKTNQFFLYAILKESSEREIFFKYFPHCIVKYSQRFPGNRVIVEETCNITNIAELKSRMDIYLSSRQVDFVVEFCGHFDGKEDELPQGFMSMMTEVGDKRIVYGCIPTKLRYDFHKRDNTGLNSRLYLSLVCLSTQPLKDIAETVLQNVDEATCCYIVGIEKDALTDESIYDDKLLLSDVLKNECRLVFGNFDAYAFLE
jgi:hypothetical protein